MALTPKYESKDSYFYSKPMGVALAVCPGNDVWHKTTGDKMTILAIQVHPEGSTYFAFIGHPDLCLAENFTPWESDVQKKPDVFDQVLADGEAMQKRGDATEEPPSGPHNPNELKFELATFHLRVEYYRITKMERYFDIELPANCFADTSEKVMRDHLAGNSNALLTREHGIVIEDSLVQSKHIVDNAAPRIFVTRPNTVKATS